MSYLAEGAIHEITKVPGGMTFTLKPTSDFLVKARGKEYTAFVRDKKKPQRSILVPVSKGIECTGCTALLLAAYQKGGKVRVRGRRWKGGLAFKSLTLLS